MVDRAPLSARQERRDGHTEVLEDIFWCHPHPHAVRETGSYRRCERGEPARRWCSVVHNYFSSKGISWSISCITGGGGLSSRLRSANCAVRLASARSPCACLKSAMVS